MGLGDGWFIPQGKRSMKTLYPSIPITNLQAIGIRALFANLKQAQDQINDEMRALGAIDGLTYSLEGLMLVPQATDEPLKVSEAAGD